MISIKVDVKSRKDESDPKSEVGYWGATSGEEKVTMKQLLDIMAKRDNMGIHEYLVGEKYRPYADVDAGAKQGITAENFKVKQYEILKAARDVMEETFPDAQFHLFDRSGQKPDGSWKVSGHFIGTDIYFTDKEHIRYLLEQAEGTEYFDFDVYNKNHLFFMPNCTKPGDKRRLRYAEVKTIGDISDVFLERCNEERKCKKCLKFKACDFMDEDTIRTGLITLVESDEKKMPVPDGFKPKEENPEADWDDKPMNYTEEQKAAQLEKLKKLVAALATARALTRASWRLGVCAIRNNAMKWGLLPPCLQLAQEFAKKMDGFSDRDKEDTNTLYITGDDKLKVGYTFLKKWADEDTPNWDTPVDFSIAAGEVFDIETIRVKMRTVKTSKDLDAFADAVVEYMNKFLTLIKWGRTPFIISEMYQLNADGDREKVLDYKDVHSMNISFKNKCLVYKLADAKKPAVFKPFDCWMSHPMRNEKDRVYFSPRAFEDEKFRDPNAYNLYGGLAITRAMCKDAPDLMPDSPWLQHIRKRWCHGNEAAYNDVLNRFAMQIQKPWIKQGVVMGLMSPEGSGKGLVLQPIFKILGKRYVAIPTTAKQVLGGFNALLDGKLIVFMDELSWGGDKEHEGVLKKIITETTIAVERKGIDTIQVDSVANVISCSNEPWMMPASRKARRLFILELLAELAGSQTPVTAKIIDDILNTDILSIAKFFYNRDISGFNPRTIVQTEALRSQKLESMTPLDQTFYSIVNRGVINYQGEDKLISEATFKKADFYASVGAGLKFMTEVKFWKAMKVLWPSIVEERPSIAGKRIQYVKFPKIDVLRQEFRNAYDDQGWEFDEADQDVGVGDE
jgi:hypothetical protein